MRILTFLAFLLVTTFCSGQIAVYKDTVQSGDATPAPYQPRLTWGDIEYHGNPWVYNASQPYQITNGLQGRHVSMWASHGNYYDVVEHKWTWQRPPLYCTREDLFTQTFAVQYVYPMLERAGAIVWTPRERSWNRLEVIVDNDSVSATHSLMGTSTYKEVNGKYEWENAGTGFALTREVYHDKENPFTEGTARMAEAVNSKRGSSSIVWTPSIPKDGSYAVYLSYPQLPTNVPDATFTIRHRGISTSIRVNQQMGGGTWVYVGEFDFSAGNTRDNNISLTNISNYRGTVAADAIRLGGGMSNIARSDSTGVNPTMSGLPRYLEAGRYYTQWAGFPYEVYSAKNGSTDYGDDINARPLSTNYLARGSVYLPGDSGLCVPLELSLAMHSDAGYFVDDSYVGSLGIFTSDFEDGILPSGLSRMASGEMSNQLLLSVNRDLNRLYGNWVVRENRDNNYGETRIPRLPSAIFEMFSHESFAEMRLGHDPNFKFNFSRSVYKAILRYIARMHGITKVVVAPLPVEGFAAETDHINRRIKLSWKPVDDRLEATARPTSFIVYTKHGEYGWDNGTVVSEPVHYVDAEEDVLYSFRVEALNTGGRSMPSEELCAMLSSVPYAPQMLIVNGFTRLASPQVVDNEKERGFDLNSDPGVAYMHTPAFCGHQISYDRSGLGVVNDGGQGWSNDDMAGTLVCGNTFDYPTLHAGDFSATGHYNISSCSRNAFENHYLNIDSYKMIDLILGAQRDDGYSISVQHDVHTPTNDFTTLSPAIQKILSNYISLGGRLLLSGAYIGTDFSTADDTLFAERVLHLEYAGREYADSLLIMQGMNTQSTLLMRPNEDHLSTAFTSIVQPKGEAFSILTYGSAHSAAIAYKGVDSRTISLGFPIEHIQEASTRRQLMAAFANFLLK